MSYEIFESLCRSRSVTPAAVSKATGIAHATLTAWKKGNYTPKADKLQKIADYFGVSIEYLRTGVTPDGYYADPDVIQIAQQIHDNEQLRLVFDVASDLPPEELTNFYNVLLALKKAERSFRKHAFKPNFAYLCGFRLFCHRTGMDTFGQKKLFFSYF